MQKLLVCLAFLSVLIPHTSIAAGIKSSVDVKNLEASKMTPFGKYLSSRDAFELLKSDPEIFFVDVRDPIEISQSGHPEPIDAIVPLRVQTEDYDTKLGEYSMRDNPEFLRSMQKALGAWSKSKHDMIIITCGSGYRSAAAARKLAEAGYTNVWHIPDGYPGDKKPGLNAQNAWNLSGLPWNRTIIHGSEWVKFPPK